MDEIINLLSCICSTMDTISVTGIDNQDKFVGCANAIKTVIRQLRDVQPEKQNAENQEVNNG